MLLVLCCHCCLLKLPAPQWSRLRPVWGSLSAVHHKLCSQSASQWLFWRLLPWSVFLLSWGRQCFEVTIPLRFWKLRKQARFRKNTRNLHLNQQDLLGPWKDQHLRSSPIFRRSDSHPNKDYSYHRRACDDRFIRQHCFPVLQFWYIHWLPGQCCRLHQSCYLAGRLDQYWLDLQEPIRCLLGKQWIHWAGLHFRLWYAVPDGRSDRRQQKQQPSGRHGPRLYSQPNPHFHCHHLLRDAVASVNNDSFDTYLWN